MASCTEEICVIYVLFLSCFRVCSLLPCGHLKGRANLLALVCDENCDCVTFPFGILGQVWYRFLILAVFLTSKWLLDENERELVAFFLLCSEVVVVWFFLGWSVVCNCAILGHTHLLV